MLVYLFEECRHLLSEFSKEGGDGRFAVTPGVLHVEAELHLMTMITTIMIVAIIMK